MRDVLSLDTNWTSGEIPAPLIVQMLDPPQDITGYAVQVRMDRDGVEFTPAGVPPVALADPLASTVRVKFGDGDIAVASGTDRSLITIEVWISGSGSRLASKTIINDVYAQVGAAPTI
jgi:hypothetical protein